MEHRVSYTIIGAFVIVLGAMLVAALLWLAAGGATGHYKEYVIYLQSGAGALNSNSPVLYHGVPVGRVAGIRLDQANPTRAKVVLSIRSDAPIKEDTQAEVDTRGVTGAGYISLSGGSPKSPPLKAEPGKKMPVIPTRASSTASLTSAAQDVAQHLVSVTRRLNKVLSDKNIKALSDSLHNIATLTANLAARSRDLNQAIQRLNATLGNANAASKHLPALIEQTQQTIATFNRVAGKIGGVATGVSKTTTHLSLLAPQAQSLLLQLSQASRSLNQLLDELKRQPNTIVFGKPAHPGPGEHHPHHSGG